MLRDLSQGNGLSIATVKDILHTPAVLGGMGVFPYGQRFVSFSSERREQVVNMDISQFKGIGPEIQRLSERGVKLTEKTILDQIVNRLEFTKVDEDIISPKEFRSVVAPPNAARLLEYSSKAGANPPVFQFGANKSPKSCPKREEWNKGVFSSSVLRQQIEAKEYQWIKENWVDPEYAVLSERIEKRGGRRVWLSWLLDDLPFSLPILFDYSDLQISVIYTELWRQGLTTILNRQRFSYNSFVELALATEIRTREIALNEKVRLGG
jgi:hypothetical protein